MLVLAIDTSTTHVQVAVGADGVVVGSLQLAGERRHAEQLVPAIRHVCDETGVELGALAAIAVGVGPGLFSGLRVGVTTAVMTAHALRVPVVAVPSLDLVAYPLRHAGCTVVAVLDARRHEVFHAGYRPVPGGVQRVTDYATSTPAALVTELSAGGDEVLIAGDGALRYPDELSQLERARHAGPAFALPSVAALVELSTERFHREEFSTPFDVRPLYVRESDVQIKWEVAGR